jgi:D-amino peptidase
MNIVVMVDMEGISGICRKSQVRPDGEHYQAARRYLTWDTNACVDGCFRGGADRVTVCDAHGSGFNFVWEELDPRASYAQGAGRRGPRLPGIEKADGMILLGYHAMAGTPQAILEHTMSSAEWQNFWLNGRKAGEVAIDAGLAGDHGVPTLMVSGDDKVCSEARRLIKGVVAVEVKQALDLEYGILLPREVAHERIRDGAARAVRQCRKIRPFKVRRPVRMRLELVSRGVVPAGRAGVRVIDGRTYEVTGPTVEAALQLLCG